MDVEDVASLQREKTIEVVLNKLAGLLKMFPVYAQIHAVYLTRDSWTIENGLLTPTLKVKRNEVEKRFVKEIKGLYRGHVMVE